MLLLLTFILNQIHNLHHMRVTHLALAAIIFCSCSKNNDNPIDKPDPNPEVNKFEFASLENFVSPEIYSIVKDSVWSDKTSSTMVLNIKKSSRQPVRPEFQTNIYPGATIKGNTLAKNTSPESFTDYKVLPITISPSFPYKLPLNGNFDNPSYETTNAFIKSKLSSNPNSGNSLNRFDFRTTRLTHMNELRLLFGYNADVNALFGVPEVAIKTSTVVHTSPAEQRSGTLTRVLQESFTIDMDMPDELIFGKEADQQKLKDNEVNYVSSVTYGRLGYLAVQAASISQKELELLITKIQQEKPVTDTEKQLLGRMQIYAYMYGYSKAAMAGVNAAKGFEKADKFFAMVKNEGKYTPDNFGSPLFYFMHNALGFSEPVSPTYTIRVNVERK